MARDERRPRRRFCLVVLAVGIASAAFLVTPSYATIVAADAANALEGWYGSLPVQFTVDPEKPVDGSIDYAVYAPGKFNLSFPGQDPSNGARYVYRYQLHNNDVSVSSDYIKKLTIALVGDTQAANCMWIEPTSGPYSIEGFVPDYRVRLTGSPPTSAIWYYRESSALQPGSDSKMLIFTSPYGPTYRLATIGSSSAIGHSVDYLGNQYNQWEGMVPSPVPEPASLCSLLLFGGILAVIRALWPG